MTTTSASLIYPALPDPLTSGDLQELFNPSFDERRWAPSVARTPETQVALLVHLKIFQTIGRFMPARGMQLSRRLKDEVGPAYRVVYDKPCEDPNRRIDERTEFLADGARLVLTPLSASTPEPVRFC